MTTGQETGEEIQLLADAARSFLSDLGGVGRLRRRRDSFAELDDRCWSEMAALGWTSITVPEEHGGSGLGLGAVAPLLEEMGHALAVEPLLAGLFATELLKTSACGAQRKTWLPAAASGEARFAVAGPRRRAGADDPASVFRHADGHIEVCGDLGLVRDAAVADVLMVVGRLDQSEVCAVIPVGSEGLAIEPTALIDSRPWAAVRIDRVAVPEDLILGVDREAGWLSPILDTVTVGHCLETLGAMWEAFDRTVDYTKSREQFDQTIASFQAIQHRLARLYSVVLMADAATRGALSSLGRGDPDSARLVSAAKVRCDLAARAVADESVQLHGGIGVTDECDIGLFLKRLRVSELIYGDTAWHLDRWADLGGY